MVQVNSGAVRREAVAIQNLARDEETTKEAAWALRKHRDTLDETMAIQDEHLNRLLLLKGDLRKLEREIQPLHTAWNPKDAAIASWNTVVSAWNLELITVEDRSVTIGKLALAMLLLCVGYFMSRRLSRSLGRVLQERFKMHEGTSAGLESLAFYTMLCGFTMFGLQFAGVPLTLFAFLGGALAIGLGFGSQNILNNFISGLILLAERPIRVGDVLDLDDELVIVQSIGPRCTRVRTPDNVDMLIPNSTFLENKVVNWTHGDPRARIHVDVGVAYGSPTRKVEELLFEALKEIPEVISHPKPVVIFNDFGSSSLDFKLMFWVRFMKTTSRPGLLSKVRFRIDELFREHDIEIPFPQRDLHIKPGPPIRMNMDHAQAFAPEVFGKEESEKKEDETQAAEELHSEKSSKEVETEAPPVKNEMSTEEAFENVVDSIPKEEATPAQETEEAYYTDKNLLAVSDSPAEKEEAKTDKKDSDPAKSKSPGHGAKKSKASRKSNRSSKSKRGR